MTPGAGIARATWFPRALAVDDLDHSAWADTPPVTLAHDWRARPVRSSRHATAALLWTPDALVVRFRCAQDEPWVVRAAPDRTRKVLGLWDHDVCEMFVAPAAALPWRYYEFEVAPTGEWVDLAIDWRPDGRITDWDHASGMSAAARIDASGATLAVAVPWASLGGAPRAGDRWRVNLFRCAGPAHDRSYLAWQPTHAPEPAFHDPRAFGWLEFAPPTPGDPPQIAPARFIAR